MQRGSHGNAPGPSFKRTLATVLVEAGKNLNERVLQGVFGFGAVGACQRSSPTGGAANGTPLKAYEALRAGLNENPASLPLLRAYVLAAADAGLTEYAAEALAQLRRRLSPAAAATLAAEYAAHQAARAAAAASFADAPTSFPLQ